MSAPPPAVAVPRRRTRARAVALVAPALGGALYFLGYVGYGVWPCLLVFLVPLWTALERTDGWRPAAAAGLAFGATAYVGGFLWLWRLVPVFLDGNRILGGILWVMYGAWFALGFAVYGALFHGVRRQGWPIAVAGVAPLVAVEWLQPQLFPLYAGNGLVAAPTWIQLADVGGPLVLTALLGVANVAVLAAARRSGTAVVAIAVVGAALVYGRVRMAAVDAAVAAAPALRVGVVQANLGVLEKTALGLVTHQRHLDQTRELLAAGPVDLVVWPETAYVRGLRRPLPLSGRPILEDVSVPLLFGGSSVEERDGRRWKANSAFLVGADGVIRDAYDKNLLIPLAEYVPFASLVPARWFPQVDDFGAATDVPALHLGTWRIVTPICYEAIRPEFVRRMVRASHPHLLVTLANDAWFGDSQEPWLHLALAQLRAVEHRRFVVRATNSGVSAVVDPAGRIVARTGVLTRETLRATVHPLDGETVYARLGDWPGWLATAIVVVGVALSAPGRSGSSRRPASRTAARARDGC